MLDRQAILRKIFRLTCRANQWFLFTRLASIRGTLAIVTNVGRDAVDAFGAQDECINKRTAKSCGPDVPTLVSSWRQCSRIVADDGDNKPGSPRRSRRKPLKPLRREGRAFRRTCGDYARVLFTFAREASGALRHAAFPAPSVFEVRKFMHNSDVIAPREWGGARVGSNLNLECDIASTAVSSLSPCGRGLG